MRREAFRLT
jgi:hypothetical protein